MTAEEVAAAKAIAAATSGAPLAYEVVIWERGHWVNDWDGELHATRELGETAVTEARDAGFEAHLAELRL